MLAGAEKARRNPVGGKRLLGPPAGPVERADEQGFLSKSICNRTGASLGFGLELWRNNTQDDRTGCWTQGQALGRMRDVATGSGERSDGALRSDRAIAVSVPGTALLLIDVMKDLDFEWLHVLVAQAEPMALRLSALASVRSSRFSKHMLRSQPGRLSRRAAAGHEHAVRTRETKT